MSGSRNDVELWTGQRSSAEAQQTQVTQQCQSTHNAALFHCSTYQQQQQQQQQQAHLLLSEQPPPHLST